MNYTVQSKMFAKWQGLVWIIGPVAYLGLLVAPSVVVAVPFQSFHRHANLVGYWVTVFVVLWLIYCLGRSSYHWFARRVIHLDAVIGFAGCVLALAACVWIYPPNWTPTTPKLALNRAARVSRPTPSPIRVSLHQCRPCRHSTSIP